MNVALKKNSFTAEFNPGPADEGYQGIGVMEFESRQGKLHIAPGEYLVTTTFGEAFAVTEAQFEKYFIEVKPKPKKDAKKKE